MFPKFILFCVVFAGSHILPPSTAEKADCTETIANGVLLGSALETSDPSRIICSYMGIPYATPPLGDLRFKPPTPPAPFQELNATGFPNWCPQSGTTPEGIEMSEDCLYLNVYVPQKIGENPENLPVMIWFHGGSFTGGSSFEYTSDKLLARGDVILVVVQYRLGLLGFLSTGDAVAPGNWGLKDQAFSIQWVKDNIEAFGGKSDQLTIFGESAGGASVMLQAISPLNKGLLSGAIAQSGSAVVPWAMDHTPLEAAHRFASILLCPTSTNTLMVDCFRRVPWRNIIDTQGFLSAAGFGNLTLPTGGVAPVVEPDLPGAFITKSPAELIESGEADKMPIIIGTTKHDGSFTLGFLHLAYFGLLNLDKDPVYMKNQIVPDLLRLFRIKEDKGSKVISSTAELAYLHDVDRSSWNASMPGLVDMLTVFSYKSPAIHAADMFHKAGHTVYLYAMEHHSNNTMWDYFFRDLHPNVEHGITHADDLLYMFNPKPEQLTGNDKIFSEIFCDIWITFGRTGNPNPSFVDQLELNGRQMDEWKPYNPKEEFYLKLNVTPTLLTSYRDSWRPNGFDWN